MSREVKKAAEEFLEILKSSENAYVLTGAGASTPSGIPDFRGKDGIYKTIPVDIFDVDKFFKDPERYYKFHKERLLSFKSAETNIVHKVLAEMEEKGLIKALITQNIDGLHWKAGSKNVIELHGSMDSYVCTKCGKVYESEHVEKVLMKREIVPMCEECGGILKPDVVFFGEALPEEALMKAYSVAEEADLSVAIGTSLVVYPAALFPRITVEHGGKLVIVNLGETGLDNIAYRKYNFELTEFFREVKSLLEAI